MPIYLKSKTNLSNRLLHAGIKVDDTSTCYCDHAKTKAELGWKAKYDIEEIILPVGGIKKEGKNSEING